MPTNSNPNPGFHPIDPGIQCKFYKAAHSDVYHQKNNSSPTLMVVVMGLSSSSLLKKFLHGKTVIEMQANFSILSVFVQFHALKVDVKDAVLMYSHGNSFQCNMLCPLRLNTGESHQTDRRGVTV
ncbi:hypothetical protein TNCT_355401 [Trichonephila clavata]|uniref:Uncharacterized protein n=1 Tax=Trichonephila clavata TaxID=2740835 RepID=A0A8X6KIW0_TRICU|nr:hypothetical protein TNCT_355401 [Trichonephila clavata]